MSAASVLPPPPHTQIERSCCRTPVGIKIETWRLVESRTLPTESVRLPFSVLFDENTEMGAVPCVPNGQADTLESPPDSDVTRENPAAPYAHYEAGES
jgi:hypothetical protein